MKRPILILSIIAIALLSACGNKTAQGEQGDTLKLKYAKLLTIVKHDSFTTVDIADPWHKGKVLHRYVLVPRKENTPKDLSEEGTIIRIPVKRSIIFTTVHCSLVQTLGAQTSIAGVCDLKYIKIPWIQEQCRAKKMADCGEGMGPDIEKIIDTKPDVIMLSPFQNSGGYGKLEDIGVPLVECADYMEYSSLGRAEWMKFYGLLFGKEAEADNLFNEVDNNYKTLKKKASAAKVRPTVLMDKLTGSVWYVPGGKSTLGQMIADAGGHFAFADDNHNGSVALPLENVLSKASDAEIWLMRNSGMETYKILLSENGAYAQFKAFNNKKVYCCDVEGSKFYEQSPFRPDYLLEDFIHIFHPDIMRNDKQQYFFAIK